MLGIAGIASPAMAQDGTTLAFPRDGWDVGAISETQSGHGLTVQLQVIQRDVISGEPMIYVRARFCNLGFQPWSGGQRVSSRNVQATKATLRVPVNECRTWTEWLPRNVQTIYVYLQT